ncbi:hypothetical protein J6590_106662 [Homalodisca vitripennis]|nr:hypothetical protein J6590_106662 [Homalodisca vitripennis]
MMMQHPNVTLLKASEAERHFHTRQGMHYNYRGKVWLAEKISKAINKMGSNAQNQALVNMELSLNEEELSEKYTEQGGAELQGSLLKRHEGMKHPEQGNVELQQSSSLGVELAGNLEASTGNYWEASTAQTT